MRLLCLFVPVRNRKSPLEWRWERWGVKERKAGWGGVVERVNAERSRETGVLEYT